MQTMQTTRFESALLGEHYDRVLHRSGLTVYLFPKKLTTTYAILSAAYGAMDASFRTPDGRIVTMPDGVAHFLEHKLFENPDGSDSFARFSAYDADANAYTTANRTAYLFSCTAQPERALEELLTFVTTPYFTPETVQKERGIIAEEIRMYDDSPWDRCYQRLMEAMYEHCGIRNSICGTERSISEITDRMLYECYQMFYQLSNMVLVVCGDIDQQAVLAVCDRCLPEQAAPASPIVRVCPPEPANVRLAQTAVQMQVAKPIFTLGFKDAEVPADAEARARRYAAMELLDEAVFSRSGALYSALFEEGLLTASYSYGYSNTDRCGFHTVSGEGDDPYAIERRIVAYLEALAREGIPAEEVERARRVLYADELQSYDSTEEIANELLSYVMDGTEPFRQPELIASVTAEELNALLPTLLREGCRCLSVVKPFGTDKEPLREV